MFLLFIYTSLRLYNKCILIEFTTSAFNIDDNNDYKKINILFLEGRKLSYYTVLNTPEVLLLETIMSKVNKTKNETPKYLGMKTDDCKPHNIFSSLSALQDAVLLYGEHIFIVFLISLFIYKNSLSKET